ncbi:hypothetical protein R3P38DRAFT_2934660 [Favolaschia claudopus]|uniref:Gamma-glutamylcyclotransferase AIG2-like domain-containing protein n=1 Tax=Favolaschia claudopus TaxID=2862362 RepID=A0AAW0BT58_9AGAR
MYTMRQSITASIRFEWLPSSLSNFFVDESPRRRGSQNQSPSPLHGASGAKNCCADQTPRGLFPSLSPNTSPFGNRLNLTGLTCTSHPLPRTLSRRHPLAHPAVQHHPSETLSARVAATHLDMNALRMVVRQIPCRRTPCRRTSMTHSNSCIPPPLSLKHLWLYGSLLKKAILQGAHLHPFPDQVSEVGCLEKNIATEQSFAARNKIDVTASPRWAPLYKHYVCTATRQISRFKK